MTLKRSKAPSGTVVVLEHVSRILKDNPLRDPHVRKVAARLTWIDTIADLDRYT